MTYEKPDGRIEIESSGCCCPPGPKRQGIHTRGFTHWWRISHGKPMTDWTQCSMGAESLAESAKTCREFVEAMP